MKKYKVTFGIDELKAQLKAVHESRAEFVQYNRVIEND